MTPKLKICGITQWDQAQAIVNLGVNYLGFIQVLSSPRYCEPSTLKTLLNQITFPTCPPAIVGVFANSSLTALEVTQNLIGFDVVQLHGQETPDLCQAVKTRFPQVELWKAFRIRHASDLQQILPYEGIIDTLLLDAYHPELLGGTGHTLDWSSLRTFQPPCPWLLAGGITPENVGEALAQVSPQGIDVSSGVERSPGDKDLDKVQRLIEAMRSR